MTKFLKDRLPYVIFIIIIFVIGIIFGTTAVNSLNYGSKESVFSYFNDFINNYKEIEYSQKNLIGNSIKFNLLNLVIIWAVGISVFIVPLVVVIIFFKGFVIGFTVGFLVSEYGFKGILFSIFTVFPQNIFIVPAFLLAGIVSLSFSMKIIKYYRNRGRLSSEDFINYSLEMLVLGLVLTGGSLIETFFSPFLMRLLVNLL